MCIKFKNFRNFQNFQFFYLILEVSHQSLTLMDTDFGQSLLVSSPIRENLHSVPDILLDFN